MAALTWNRGCVEGHDTSDASPHLPSLMPNGSRNQTGLLYGAKKRITWSLFCQDVYIVPSFNLVLFSSSVKVLKP